VDIDSAQKLSDLSKRSEKERARFYARRPKRAGDVIAAVIAKHGYAAVKGADLVRDGWAKAAPEALGDAAIAGMTAAGVLKRGVLEVMVANHVVMQEINFHRPALLAATQAALPDSKITALRFKVGRIN
jgi:predicted nucleic acid-binding Zn ribbon protein